MSDPIRVLSLGAGVQSSALLFAYLTGKLTPKPDFAVFADTQAEPKRVYEWLEILKREAAGKIEIITATAGSITDDYLNRKRFAAIPFYMTSKSGQEGMARRQCTREYKIDVIKKAIRLKLGYPKGDRVKHKVDTILGISTDEASRMKPSQTPWMTNKWPLIEELEWSRGDCFRFIMSFGLGEPPKSACYICPYRSNESWRDMKRDDPEAFESAVRFEAAVRENKERLKFDGDPFLHSSRKPLGKIDWNAIAPESRELFENECEGMCGV